MRTGGIADRIYKQAVQVGLRTGGMCIQNRQAGGTGRSDYRRNGRQERQAGGTGRIDNRRYGTQDRKAGSKGKYNRTDMQAVQVGMKKGEMADRTDKKAE